MQITAFNTVIENEIQEYRLGPGWNIIFDPTKKIFSLDSILFTGQAVSSKTFTFESARVYYRTDAGSVLGAEHEFVPGSGSPGAFNTESQQCRLSLEKKQKVLFKLEQDFYTLSNRFAVVPDDISSYTENFEVNNAALEKLRAELPAEIAQAKAKSEKYAARIRMTNKMSIVCALAGVILAVIGSLFLQEAMLQLGFSFLVLTLLSIAASFILKKSAAKNKNTTVTLETRFADEENTLKKKIAFVDEILEESGCRDSAEFMESYQKFKTLPEKLSDMRKQVAELQSRYDQYRSDAEKKLLEYEKDIKAASLLFDTIINDTQPSEGKLIELMGSFREPVPLLLNDPFDTAQEAEITRTYKLISELSQTFQIIFLTTNKEFKDMAKDYGAKLLVVQ